ncbi:MAG: acetyl-CoA C-acyltransferase [Hyphomicrobiaceae bacterium]
MIVGNAYIIAARRSAIGRLGGLHRNRRLEDLACPVLLQALDDAGIEPARVDLLILGNTSAGNNAARLISLLAGLPDRCAALTIDRHNASGLEAITAAARRIAAAEVDVAVAGGAESLSTAPWRLAKPRSLFHMPRFIGQAQADNGESGGQTATEAAEALAARLKIPRNAQDEYAITSHIRATLARDGRRLVREIVPLKAKAEETRDELVDEPDIDDMEAYPPILGEGTVTAGNTSLPADAAAFVVVVSEGVYVKLGRPPALMIEASASVGVPPAADLEAPIVAARMLAEKPSATPLKEQRAIELAELSAVQAIAFKTTLGLDDDMLNPNGGQIARGHPAGASSAVLAVRLFTRLVRDEGVALNERGIAVSGASGGQALAVQFRRV